MELRGRIWLELLLTAGLGLVTGSAGVLLFLLMGAAGHGYSMLEYGLILAGGVFVVLFLGLWSLQDWARLACGILAAGCALAGAVVTIQAQSRPPGFLFPRGMWSFLGMLLAIIVAIRMLRPSLRARFAAVREES